MVEIFCKQCPQDTTRRIQLIKEILLSGTPMVTKLAPVAGKLACADKCPGKIEGNEAAPETCGNPYLEGLLKILTWAQQRDAGSGYFPKNIVPTLSISDSNNGQCIPQVLPEGLQTSDRDELLGESTPEAPEGIDLDLSFVREKA